jgi:hypothetical protein
MKPNAALLAATHLRIATKCVVWAAVIVLLIPTAGGAASLVVEPFGNVHSIYLHGGFDNGNFNAVIFQATTSSHDMYYSVALHVISGVDVLATLSTSIFQPERFFGNFNSGLVAGAPRPAGDAFTHHNRMLDADPEDVEGGLDWTILGLIRTPMQLSFTGGPLGGKINTASQPGGRLFIANLSFVVPESACCWQMMIAASGLVAARRSARRSSSAKNELSRQ